MRKFKFQEASGAQLVEEFCARVVADEYDSMLEHKEIFSLDKKDFDVWLDEESTKLYNMIMEQTNVYVQGGEVIPPEV